MKMNSGGKQGGTARSKQLFKRIAAITKRMRKIQVQHEGGGKMRLQTPAQEREYTRLMHLKAKIHDQLSEAMERPNPARSLPIGKKIAVFAKRLRNGRIELYR